MLPQTNNKSNTQTNQIISTLQEILSNLLGLTPKEIDTNTHFVELGVESLLLLEFSRAIQKKFNIKIPFRLLLEDFPTIQTLAIHIERSLPEKAEVDPITPALPVQTPNQNSTTQQQISDSLVEKLITQQLQVMTKQLELLRKSLSPQKTPASPLQEKAALSLAPSRQKETKENLNDCQKQHLNSLITRFVQRTQESKRLTQSARTSLANPRSITGFRPSIKEMLYPIHSTRGEGSRIWDVDGNEYIDIAMGFGSLLFGHSPSFVIEAIQEHIQQGIQHGPQSRLTGQVAELICELTGHERATFCNSGTDAVMGAIRLARAATGRAKIAMFAGSYHGMLDEVLVAGIANQDGTLQTVPLAPGIPQHMTQKVIVLNYGNPESLNILRANAHEIAAILVEPIQSRQPDLQPREFLHQLRQLTQETGIVLIFDEVITGFRMHPGGIQALWGIQADITTYGKAVGGGLPIGVVAGKAAFMDLLDGGFWNYGDASYPQAETTVFAGTFFKHPLMMAVAWALLNHMKQSGSQLQEKLTQKTTKLAETLNTYFQQKLLPIRITHFGSLFRFTYPSDLPWTNLLFYHLLEKGIYVWEGRTCFLSTAHTDEDIEKIIRAVMESIGEMQVGGFLPNDSRGAGGRDAKFRVCTFREAISGAGGDVGESVTRLPLTEAQKQLWLLAQMGDEASRAYNQSSTVHLRGSFHLEAIHKAVQQIVNRHEALRTTFSPEGDYQQISSTLVIDIPLSDFSAFDDSQREAQLSGFLAQEARQTFALEKGPLLRVHIVKLEEQHHLLVLTHHHIVVDGWSFGILLKELVAIYTAVCQGITYSLPQTSQYSEYAQWLALGQQSSEMEKAEAYWLEQFAHSVPVLELPTDRPRPPIFTYAGDRKQITLDRSLYRNLTSLSAQQGCTLFTTLLSGFMVLLQRLTGQKDIVVGIAAAGQLLLKDKYLVGHCVNLLPIRSPAVEEPNFTEYLSLVKQVILAAYEHQIYPFISLIEKLNLPRDLSRAPLLTAGFNLDKVQFESNSLKQEFEIFKNTTNTTKLDLDLNIIQTDSELIVEFEYSTDLFDGQTIERWLEHYVMLLTSIVNKPEQQLWELPLLTKTQQQLLREWNETQTDFQPKNIHQLFEDAVERSPNAIALVFESQHLTYRELNDKANQLAHYLRSLGVGLETLVGICMERSLEMVIGLLGILKAGGAYVPLDPAYPQERLAFTLEDAQVPVLLTQQNLTASLPEYKAHVICLDADWDTIASHSQENLNSPVAPQDLAYIIYTSGSTGKPKGVQITHRAVVNFLNSMRQEPGLTAPDVLVAVTTISFDIAGLELYLPLIVGARIVLASREVATDAARLSQTIEQSGATVMQATPATWQLLLGAGWQGNKQLKILCGGEALNRELANQLLELVDSVWNMYGPTETTIWSTVYKVEPGNAPVPVGRPIANTQIYILDRNQRGKGDLLQLPIGIPGELHIGGDGLARGYLNRPELTAEKFIHDPFSTQPGARLYKTGDLARYLPNGNIEVIGRIDRQVKLRGFRIELGEIEAVLNTYPNILQTVVTAQEDAQGDRRIVAYLVPRLSKQAPTSNELRRFLKEKLPEYMVPAAFAILDTLPLLPNGKVNHRALIAPETRSDLSTIVAPRNPLEEAIALIWADVLGIEQVGVHDNFFELGGHSLLAIQSISRIRATFSSNFSLRDLFEKPTVADLAERLSFALRQEQSILPPLLPVARDGDLPLSFAQARLWFLARLEPNNAFYNIPAALRLSGQLNVAALERSFNKIVSRHEALRTNFISGEGQPVQAIASTLNLTIPVVDLRGLSEPEREIEAQRLATQDAVRPFNLAGEPLLRASLLQLSEAEHILLLNMHHIVSDGWSLGILLRELATLYYAYCHDLPSPLPTLPIQYADFAAWQRQWLQGKVLESQLAYWKQRLDDAPALLELPTDRPRPAIQTFRGSHQSFTLPQKLSEAIALLSQREGVTLFMTLLAAFQTLLYRYTGQPDIVVGTPTANRNFAEIESLIGFFVNTLVLCTDLSGNPSFRELLGRVKEVALGAYAHQDMPFEQLVEELQPTRDISHTPLFQVMFVLQNAPMPNLELSGLTLKPMVVENAIAKFDLTLSLENTEQGLIGSWEYNTDLFDPATIVQMQGHFQTLLESAIANPDRHLLDLPLLRTAEQQQILVEWNNTKADYPQNACIHQLFEAAVEKYPEAIAVSGREEQLTYRELNKRANQLAHYLKALGVKPEVLVGVYVQRSVEMVVGLLGILKAGGAYVPLDPAYPFERTCFMLEDAQVQIVVAQQRFVESLPNQTKIVCLDGELQANGYGAEENLASSVTTENLAYVIYTSGSTGKPKGVQIEHRGLLNLVFWHQQAFQVSPCDRMSQIAGVAFDACGLEIWPYLTAGASIYFPDDETRADPKLLQDWLLTNAISTSFLPTPLAEKMLQLDWPSDTALHTLLTGGEKLHQYPSSHPFQVINNYGPTENTVVTTFARVPAQKQPCTAPAIGRPIANNQVYILDALLQPVPVNVPGELYIGGNGLARGYLNQPQLTAQAFIPHPFSPQPGARLYKTGDRVRYLPNGNIEYLDRLDYQVKIRGFRIELGEIEAVLSQHPAVLENVVIVKDSPGDQGLVACLVSNQEQAPTVNELRSFLKEKLPDYMVPSSFVFLDALPLTPNGKIDRRACLQVADVMRSEPSLTFVAPRDWVELQLAQIWEKVLNTDPVGVKDNFFEIGGHSLLAVTLMAQIQKQFGQDLPLNTLFRGATIEQLASILRQRPDSNWSPLVEIQPIGTKQPFFCVHPAGGNVICYLDLVRHLGLEQPFYGLQALGVEREEPCHTIEEMAHHYIKALQNVQPQGPYFLGGWSMGGIVAFEMAQQLQAQGQKVALLALIDSTMISDAETEENDEVRGGPAFARRGISDLALLGSFAQELGFSSETLNFAVDRVRRLDSEFSRLEYLLEQAQMLNLLSFDVEIAQVRRLFDVFKTNVRAIQSYVPQAYAGQVTLFKASDALSQETTMGWGELATEVEIYEIPGNHYTAIRKPHVQVLADRLKACLVQYGGLV